MRFHLSLLILGLWAIVQVSPCRCADDRHYEFSGRLSSLKMDSDILGDGWHGPSGLVVDDLADTSPLTEPEKSFADRLAKVARAKGVTACADFTYTRKDKPRIVTLRVFVFKRQEDALAWWNEKYDAPEARKLYRAVSGFGDRALDSIQLAKRIVLMDNCLFTCHQLHDGVEYQRVLESYMKKMRELAKTDNRVGGAIADPAPHTT